MDNEMVYQMFVNTLTKMNENDLNKTLEKAKKLLNEKDYLTLLQMIEKEKKKS